MRSSARWQRRRRLSKDDDANKIRSARINHWVIGRLYHMAQLKDRHNGAENFVDFDRQVREAERHHKRATTKRKMDECKWRHKDADESIIATDFASAILEAVKQEAKRRDQVQQRL